MIVNNVLSLFDGMSCGQIAINRAGITYDSCYTSEIEKYPITATQHNYPDTIQLGSVTDIDVSTLPKIDLLIGGSPCQSFSFAGKRKGMSTKDEQEILTLDHYLQLKNEDYEFEGQSYLFWEYMRVLTDIRKTNPEVKFLLENVIMSEKWERVLSKSIGVNPIEINSALVSAQNRKRLYWTNIGLEPGGLFGDLVSTIQQPKDRGILLKDILEDEVDEKYYLSEKMLNFFSKYNTVNKAKGNGFNFKPKDVNEKSACLTSRYHKMGTDDTYIVASRGRNPENPKSRKSGEPNEQMLEPRFDGKTNCLTSVQKDNLVLVQNNHGFNKGGVFSNKSPTLTSNSWEHNNHIVNEGDVVACDYRSDEGFRFKKDGKTGSLMARARNDESCGQLASIDGSIRRLTPTECARLQTVPDNYFKDKDGKNIISETQQYKALGNGWTIDVIVHILSYLKKG